MEVRKIFHRVTIACWFSASIPFLVAGLVLRFVWSDGSIGTEIPVTVRLRLLHRFLWISAAAFIFITAGQETPLL
jgi:hypothetical protein